MASPALALETCESVGAVEVSDGVCEYVVTTTGVWESPSGVTTLEAILIAGGGASQYGYGGGAGEVLYRDGVTPGEIELVIGAGGVDADGGDQSVLVDGDGTTTSATGGASGHSYQAGASNGHAGIPSGTWTAPNDYPSGQGYYAATDNAPGLGVAPSDVAGVNPALWPSFAGEECYAQGGNGVDAWQSNNQDFDCGSGVIENLITVIPPFTSFGPELLRDPLSNANAADNSGSGAASYESSSDWYYGGSGRRHLPLASGRDDRRIRGRQFGRHRFRCCSARYCGDRNGDGRSNTVASPPQLIR